jgi:hypothetical protein
MMSKSIVQSERQRPRAIELMKDIYASHVADLKCGLGANCPRKQPRRRRSDRTACSCARPVQRMTEVERRLFLKDHGVNVKKGEHV